MRARLLLLCPGQGGQHPAMFDMARSAPLLAHYDTGPATGERRFDNAVAQPGIVAATLAMWEVLREHLPPPSLVAGYSVGELAAHAVAGSIDHLQAVALARQRAALMDAAAHAGPAQCLLAVSGVPVAAVAALAALGMELAIVTGEDSCIVGGLEQELPAFEAALPGARIGRLPVAVASHTRLLEAAGAPFAAALAAAGLKPGACPVLAGTSARRIRGVADIAGSLAEQIAHPILWSECMDAAAEDGISVALELGPGAALARMLQARHPGIACRSVADFRSLEGVLAWVARAMD